MESAICISHKIQALQKKPPALNEAILIMAKLGGFIGLKSDGEPGTISMGCGIKWLDDITESVNIMSTTMPAAP